MSGCGRISPAHFTTVHPVNPGSILVISRIEIEVTTMTTQAAKKKSREEQYLEIFEPQPPPVDEMAGGSLEQPSPLRVVDSVMSDESVLEDPPSYA